MSDIGTELDLDAGYCVQKSRTSAFSARSRNMVTHWRAVGAYHFEAWVESYRVWTSPSEWERVDGEAVAKRGQQ